MLYRAEHYLVLKLLSCVNRNNEKFCAFSSAPFAKLREGPDNFLEYSFSFFILFYYL